MQDADYYLSIISYASPSPTAPENMKLPRDFLEEKICIVRSTFL